jgi:hypothetical protein
MEVKITLPNRTDIWLVAEVGEDAGKLTGLKYATAHGGMSTVQMDAADLASRLGINRAERYEG